MKLVVNAATGAVVQRIESDAWGNVVSDSNPGFQPFVFVGGVFDLDTRLTHFGFRDYDSISGVWLTPEPLSRAPQYHVGMALHGAGVNSYSYTGGVPLLLVDPSGLSPQERTAILDAFDSGVNRLTWDAERLNAPYLNNISAVFWPRNTLRGCGEQADAMERWLRSSVQFKDYELSMAGGRTGPAGVFPHQWLVAASKVDNSVLILDPWANEAWETTYFEPSALFEYSNYPKKGGPGLWLGVLGSGGR